ncbi:haloacid dehalogenase type II [soil metagenome]
MARTQVITFDFYGTLVQWHEALEIAFREMLVRRGLPASGTAALASDFAAEGRRLRDTPPWKPYREVLRDSVVFALQRAGLAAQDVDSEGLIARVSCIPPHPDVPAALARLKKRYRLAAISNTDDDLIAGSLPGLGIALDAVVTAQQAQAYKPDLRLFRHAHQVLGVTPGEVVHIAASQPLDMAVCRVLGIRAFWVNRRNETAEERYRPFTEVATVAEAVPLL